MAKIEKLRFLQIRRDIKAQRLLEIRGWRSAREDGWSEMTYESVFVNIPHERGYCIRGARLLEGFIFKCIYGAATRKEMALIACHMNARHLYLYICTFTIKSTRTDTCKSIECTVCVYWRAIQRGALFRIILQMQMQTLHSHTHCSKPAYVPWSQRVKLGYLHVWMRQTLA